MYILKSACYFAFKREKNSTFCLLMSLLCVRKLPTAASCLKKKKPMPNQNFKPKPLENKLS